MSTLWNILDSAGADLVLNGHAHTYERFGPQHSTARAAPTGCAQITAGTAATTTTRSTRRPNSEARDNTTFGVLKVNLRQAAYDWDFVPVAGGTFTDSGATHAPELRPAAALLAALALASCGGDDGGSPSDVPGEHGDAPGRRRHRASAPRRATSRRPGWPSRCRARRSRHWATWPTRTAPRRIQALLGPVVGALGDRVRPTAGNHEYGTGSADGLLRPLAPRRPPRQGLVLVRARRPGTSSCSTRTARPSATRASPAASRSAGCAPTSRPTRPSCTLAYWHHARYSRATTATIRWSSRSGAP